MSFCHDKQMKGYIFFLVFYALLILGIGLIFSKKQIDFAKSLYVMHDQAVASSLLEQGVSQDIIVSAITSTKANETGEKILASVGRKEQTTSGMLPFISNFQQVTMYTTILIAIFLILVLFVGTFLFFFQRRQLYQHAEKVISNYISGDYSIHLPQNNEGDIFRIFSSIEQLATVLQSKHEIEHKAKEFLKNTISDISHQLKTPLAALTMYQEIIVNEPENPEIVKEFSLKMGFALKRMEQLIQSMLKITRLDAGNIVFEKNCYSVAEVIKHSLNELITRAEKENKNILIEGDPEQNIVCDMEWTSEAIGNIIKNALDHTEQGNTIHIIWERTPIMLRIFISDNGNGIAQEDIHHIFKRFYRSKHSLDIQGIGLGLSLTKSIVEGQGGVISVQSELGKGTTFTISMLTKM